MEEWAAFDSGVGFGSITLEEPFDSNQISGHFSVKGDAFRPRKTTDESEELQDDLRSFFSGYLQGVLEYVLPKEQFDSSKESFAVECLISRKDWPNELVHKYPETEIDVSVYFFKRMTK